MLCNRFQNANFKEQSVIIASNDMNNAHNALKGTAKNVLSKRKNMTFDKKVNLKQRQPFLQLL